MVVSTAVHIISHMYHFDTVHLLYQNKCIHFLGPLDRFHISVVDNRIPLHLLLEYPPPYIRAATFQKPFLTEDLIGHIDSVAERFDCIIHIKCAYKLIHT